MNDSESTQSSPTISAQLLQHVSNPSLRRVYNIHLWNQRQRKECFSFLTYEALETLSKNIYFPKHNPPFSPSQCSLDLWLKDVEENAFAAERMKQNVKHMDELLRSLCSNSKEKSMSFLIKTFINKLSIDVNIIPQICEAKLNPFQKQVQNFSKTDILSLSVALLLREVMSRKPFPTAWRESCPSWHWGESNFCHPL